MFCHLLPSLPGPCDETTEVCYSVGGTLYARNHYLFESLSSRTQVSSSLRPLPWCPESQNILAYVDNDMVIATLGPLHHLKCCVNSLLAVMQVRFTKRLTWL